MHRQRPLIGVIADRRPIDPHVFNLVGEKYLLAVAEVAGALPVGVPVLAGGFDVREVLERLDGLLLTGSPSDVEPARYGASPGAAGALRDPERDAAALALVPAAIRAGLPLLGICRGFQEMNVALGGTLHQAVHDVPGFDAHHEDPQAPVEVQYAPVHPVSFAAGGMLEELTGERNAVVNSVHRQGVDRLAEGLAVEATAPDGLIEAFSVRDAPGFALGVQWHPEWRAAENPLSAALFQAFGEAARRYRA